MREKSKKIIEIVYILSLAFFLIFFSVNAYRYFRFKDIFTAAVLLVFMTVAIIKLIRHKNASKSLGKTVAGILVSVFAICLVSALSMIPTGLISYRPVYTYGNYRDASLISKDFFPESVDASADNIRFRVTGEYLGQNYVCLSYTTEDKEHLEKIINESEKSAAATGDKIGEVNCNGQSIQYIYMQGDFPEDISSGQYTFYYQSIEGDGEHVSFIAINKTGTIVYFDS